MLVGRERECALIDRLLLRAVDGRSGALVFRGEPGIGKTALLNYAQERAQDVMVVRALGVESEAELQFSALLELCRPLLDRLADLPSRQADALRGALGIGEAEAVDRLAVGGATLSLLAAAAEEAPLLVLIDDAHWLDRSSADALLFAVRRLEADRVAVLLTVRAEEGYGLEAPGLRTVELGVLDREDADSLLATRGPIAAEVAEHIHAVTRGNPLALLELPSLLTAGQLSGEEPLADPLPAGSALERAFADRAAELPDDARQALVVAAVSSSCDLDPLVDALGRVGLGATSLEPAEDVGLVHLGDAQLVFRHPLVRSAVFHAALPSQRRAAHRALAEALARGRRPEERAWHLAAAALGPDEEAASALSQAAQSARDRSGYAAAAAAHERAARLTPDDDLRRARLSEAAEAGWLAGRGETAIALLDEALEGAESPPVRARMLHLRGQIEHLAGNVPASTRMLLDAASLIEGEDPDGAVAILSDAVEACLFSDLPRPALEAGARARQLAARDGGPLDFLADAALGTALFVNGRTSEAAQRLERALTIIASSPQVAGDVRRLCLAAIAASWLDRQDDGLEFAARAIEVARRRGAFSILAHALEISAWLALRSGRWREAYAYASEGLALGRESGVTTVVAYCLSHLGFIDAAQGNEARCQAHCAEAIELAAELGIISQWPKRALALLDLGLGRLDDAVRRLEEIDSSLLERGYYERGANLVEAYWRLGRNDAAGTALALYFAPVADRSFVDKEALGARCRGLLADEAESERHFRDAIGLHGSIHDRFGEARTRLCLGERLRRAGRRIDARDELRAALTLFEELAADPWAERARVELRASGERLRRREPHEGEELTPQEMQVALQVAEGKTNKEVGAALFLSPKTVDFHLRRVYRKLSISSRGELIRRFAMAGRDQPAPAMRA
jgi:DNA-binding CsgD family transcriptional regulator